MTKEDALLYFPIDDDTDIDDLYDELLFEQKQFLSNRMPISKVFNSRISRLKKINEAYLFFGGVPNNANDSVIDLITTDSSSLEESYQIFQQNLNKIKLELFKARNVHQLLYVIDCLFKNQFNFAQNLDATNDLLETQPIVSKEPDAMEITQAIQAAKIEGITFFYELSQLPSDNILVQEANRLSLWLKLETHV